MTFVPILDGFLPFCCGFSGSWWHVKEFIVWALPLLCIGSNVCKLDPPSILVLHYPGVCLPLKPGSFQQTRVPNSLPMGVNYVDYEPQGTEVIPVYLQTTP